MLSSMRPPVPQWLRDYDMNFSDIECAIDATYGMAKGKLGTLTATVSHPCFQPTKLFFDIYAVETQETDTKSSKYTRRIVLGNPATADIVTGFQQINTCNHDACPGKKVSTRGAIFHPSSRTLWCMNCWSDDMYDSGMGGVGVPPFILYQICPPQAFVNKLRTCNTCHSNFTVVGAELPNCATLFVPMQRKVLEEAVQTALSQKGIVGAIRRKLQFENSMPLEMRKEITAVALRPERIERLVQETGMAPWDVLESM